MERTLWFPHSTHLQHSDAGYCFVGKKGEEDDRLEEVCFVSATSGCPLFELHILCPSGVIGYAFSLLIRHLQNFSSQPPARGHAMQLDGQTDASFGSLMVYCQAREMVRIEIL